MDEKIKVTIQKAPFVDTITIKPKGSNFDYVISTYKGKPDNIKCSICKKNHKKANYTVVTKIIEEWNKAPSIARLCQPCAIKYNLDSIDTPENLIMKGIALLVMKELI